MKASIKQEKPEFHPVTLTITLESPDEVRAFYHRMNAPCTWIQDYSPVFVRHAPSNVDAQLSEALYSAISLTARELEKQDQ